MTRPNTLETAAEYVLARAEIADCWTFSGSKGGGYGRVYMRGRRVGAHRVVWEWLVGPIPEGLVLDHLCRNKACVNPDHLRVVTNAENVKASPIPHYNTLKTECIYGHSLADAYIRKDGKRDCRPCALRYQREYYDRKKHLAVRSPQ